MGRPKGVKNHKTLIRLAEEQARNVVKEDPRKRKSVFEFRPAVNASKIMEKDAHGNISTGKGDVDGTNLDSNSSNGEDDEVSENDTNIIQPLKIARTLNPDKRLCPSPSSPVDPGNKGKNAMFELDVQSLQNLLADHEEEVYHNPTMEVPESRDIMCGNESIERTPPSPVFASILDWIDRGGSISGVKLEEEWSDI